MRRNARTIFILVCLGLIGCFGCFTIWNHYKDNVENDNTCEFTRTYRLLLITPTENKDDFYVTLQNTEGVQTVLVNNEEKLELEDFSKSKKKFFVRSSSSKEDIEKVFGNVEYVDANIDGEFGFITEKISEATFAKKADELGTVISRIRIEG